MYQRMFRATVAVQIICWSIIIWLITQEGSVQATVLFQASTPAPFLDAIYYGTQDVWQIFDHNLPLGGDFQDSNNDVTHYNGTVVYAVTATPNPNVTPQGTPTVAPPYIPTPGYGYDQHGGIDYSLQYEPVLAAASGLVQYAGWSDPADHRDGYGLYVILNHAPQNNYDTWYGHLSVLTVKTGQSVTVDPNDPGNRNRILGISGNTGSVFGTGGGCGPVEDDPTCGQHLHFEVRIHGAGYKPVNPYGWIAVNPSGTPVPDPWAIYTPTPPNPSGAASYDIWQNKPAIVVNQTDQYPGGTPVAEPPVNEARMVVDDGSADFTTATSCWSTNPFYASYNSLHHRAPATGSPTGCRAEWAIRPDAFTPPGDYDVYVHIPSDPAASRGAVYTVRHNYKDSQAIVVQAAYSNEEELPSWVYIGRYDFAMDNNVTEYIELKNKTLKDDPNNYVLADAIRLVPATSTPPPVDKIYVSFQDAAFQGGGQAGNIPYDAEDILAYDTRSNTWSLLFDGSDVGLSGKGVDALSFTTCPGTLLSLNGQYHDIYNHDVAQFLPYSFGSSTSGDLELYEDNPPELSTSSENIDGMGFSSDSKQLLSTSGVASVTPYQFQAEDVFLYDPDGFAPYSPYLDGSAVGLTTSNENVNGLWVDAATDDLYLTTLGTFSVNGVSGDGADIFICDRASPTSCVFGPGLFWNGSAHGMMIDSVDALSLNTSATNCALSFWSQHLSDAAHTGYNVGETFLEPPFEERWSFTSIVGGDLSQPVAHGNRIYFVESILTTSVVYAMEPNGNLIWLENLSGSLKTSSTPLLATFDKLFVALQGTLYALDSASGEELWSSSFPSNIKYGPVYDGGLLYLNIQGSGGRVYAVDTSTGQDIWAFTPTGGANETYNPVVVNEHLLFSFTDTQGDYAVSLNKETGEEEWRQEVPIFFSGEKEMIGNPDHDLVYYVAAEHISGNTEYSLVALNVKTSEIEWTYELDSGGSNNLILADGILYYNSYEYLYALDAQTGESLYEVGLSEPAGGAHNHMVMANGIIYVVQRNGDSEDSFIHAYTATTGGFLGKLSSRPTASSVNQSPTIANGQLYVLYDDDELAVYGQQVVPPR